MILIKFNKKIMHIMPKIKIILWETQRRWSDSYPGELFSIFLKEVIIPLNSFNLLRTMLLQFSLLMIILKPALWIKQLNWSRPSWVLEVNDIPMKYIPRINKISLPCSSVSISWASSSSHTGLHFTG